MNVLLIIDDYLPDSYKAGAVIMHDLAIKLIGNGHQVTVVTPSAEICAPVEKLEIDGVQLLRFKTGPIKNTGKIKRAINESLMSYRAYAALGRVFSESRHDLIVYYSPSIFWGGLVNRLKKLWSCPAYLVVRDIFPQWVVDEGILQERSPICKYFRSVEKKCYAAADRIGVQSPSNLKYFKNMTWLDQSKLEVLYNWCTPQTVEDSGAMRKTHGLVGKVIFFFGGNLGHAQDMANVLRLADRLKKYPAAHFLLVGQGDEVVLIKKAISAAELANITYLPPVSQDEYLKILAEVDVGLFSLHRDHKMDNIPGKILGYMACEKPILGSVNPGNDVIDLLQNAEAGFVTENGDDDQFYRNAIAFLEDSDLRAGVGAAGKQLLVDVFSTETAVEKVLALIE